MAFAVFPMINALAPSDESDGFFVFYPVILTKRITFYSFIRLSKLSIIRSAMKTSILFLISLFLLLNASDAQPPRLIKYQGLARDASGNTISNHNIGLQISIRQDSLGGNIIYR